MFSIRTQNQLIAVTGPPDSGKSSFVHALLGHMAHKSGSFLKKGRSAYFPEQPFMLDGSVKENILFYEEFHSLNYYSALSLASLNMDILGSQPGYDDIPVRYLNLSKEQKQKISLARALFSDRDTIVLEEPLSALDDDREISETFQRVTDKLLESGKTVIVVTQNDNVYNMGEFKLVNWFILIFFFTPRFYDIVQKYTFL